ncbi:MurR/RpiR family transcriptional regulator [Bacillaceae bacterium SIJ1]|uniref:MurR/RpiR family transcriptional regulator n=1 Tax=Litoribacterium kuwaitense TaxID=1398745 RepID=UPI0013ED3C41|nr:MurR/RpiR family transcriptional regulator [Litoribacterium kuwaitense]NGP46668.1 MurR/RpiR family transcriptional regulator [Litoribacterium kuwaitense]
MKINERIREKYPSLSSSQQKVAYYILENMEEVVIASAHKVAMSSDVSETTVHRLTQQLGYESFTAMKQDIHQFIRQDYRALNNLITTTTLKQDNWLHKHFILEAENIIKTSEELNQEDIATAAQKLLNASQIWIAGWRMSFSVTSYMQFILNYMLGKGILVPQGETAEYAAYIKGEDVVFICAFPRYDKRTLEFAKIAREKGALVIGLTDSPLSAACKHIDLPIFVKCKSKGFLDSYTAAVSVCNAIVNEISFVGEDVVKKNIKDVEDNFVRFNQTYDWKYE